MNLDLSLNAGVARTPRRNAVSHAPTIAKSMIFATILLLSLTAFLSNPVSANQAYHTQNLELTLTQAGMLAGNPVLRAGHVVNIHASGPNIGAIERYLIEGAKPNTSYNVVTDVFLSCGGTHLLQLHDTVLMTNGNGDAQGGIVLSDTTLDGFVDGGTSLTLGVQWSLLSGGIAAYQTVCTTVTLV